MAQSKWPEVEEKLILVEGWARDGLTEEQIAHNLGIGITTLKTYKKEHPTFLSAIKRGKEVVDREVENALCKNAQGHSYVEEQGFKVKKVYYDKEGRRCETEDVVTVEVTRYKPPDVTAQIFWLKNRKPAEWRDKRETEISGPDGGPIEVKTNLSDAELDARIRELMEEAKWLYLNLRHSQGA